MPIRKFIIDSITVHIAPNEISVHLRAILDDGRAHGKPLDNITPVALGFPADFLLRGVTPAIVHAFVQRVAGDVPVEWADEQRVVESIGAADVGEMPAALLDGP